MAGDDQGRRAGVGRQRLPATGAAAPNLEVNEHALAARVQFAGARASGIEYLQGGARHSAQARREVLLCGGSINSPQLLELSGIGDAQRLRTLGIPVRRSTRRPSARACRIIWRSSYFYRSRVPTLNNELAPWYGKVRAALRYAAHPAAGRSR